MSEKKFSVKIHQLYRVIVAVCDLEILGKKFEEDNLELHVDEKFYKGKEIDEKQLLKLLKNAQTDDACFNFVGKETIEVAAKAGIVYKDHVLTVQGVPHALALV